jgi:acyl carrier protein
MIATTYARVKALILERRGLKDWHVTPVARLWADLQMDDLELASFKADLEEEFGIAPEDEELLGFQTVNDVVDWIDSRLGEQAHSV